MSGLWGKGVHVGIFEISWDTFGGLLDEFRGLFWASSCVSEIPAVEDDVIVVVYVNGSMSMAICFHHLYTSEGT